MLKPAGAKGSPNHHHAVLMNWARLRKVGIGCKPYAGWALFVKHPLAFVIEHRGPGREPFHKAFPFATKDERRRAFKEAVATYCELRTA